MSDPIITHVTKVAYGDGSLAVRAFVDGEESVLSVNLSQYGLVPNSDDLFYVKNYAENEGLPAILVRAGIATAVSEVKIGPFNSSCYMMRLTKAGVS
jgi:hypothetical protein